MVACIGPWVKRYEAGCEAGATSFSRARRCASSSRCIKVAVRTSGLRGASPAAGSELRLMGDERFELPARVFERRREPASAPCLVTADVTRSPAPGGRGAAVRSGRWLRAAASGQVCWWREAGNAGCGLTGQRVRTRRDTEALQAAARRRRDAAGQGAPGPGRPSGQASSIARSGGAPRQASGWLAVVPRNVVTGVRQGQPRRCRRVVCGHCSGRASVEAGAAVRCWSGSGERRPTRPAGCG